MLVVGGIVSNPYPKLSYDLEFYYLHPMSQRGTIKRCTAIIEKVGGPFGPGNNFFA